MCLEEEFNCLLGSCRVGAILGGDAKCEIPSPGVMLELVDVFQMVTVKSCAAIGWPPCGRRASRVGTAASSTGRATD